MALVTPSSSFLTELRLVYTRLLRRSESGARGRAPCKLSAVSYIPIVLSLLVLAAHFLRGGGLPIAILLLGLLPLLAVRRPWVARLAQVVLALGALEWIRTLITLAMWRHEQGEPFLRMTLILGAVAAVTLVSALLFETRKLRRIYRSNDATD